MVFGWGVFIISFILAIILFARHKKFYPVMYMVSIALYIYTAGFSITAFQLGKFAILAVLIVSAVIFMLLGFYLSTVIHLNSKSK